MEKSPLPARSQIVHSQLLAAGLVPAIKQLPSTAHTAAAAAAALGCEVGAIANSLIFVADGSPLLVMTSGAHRVDVRVLAAEIGATQITMADAATVRRATGQAIGGVAPIGHPQQLRTVIDRALMAYPVVWTAGGTPDTVMPLTPTELRGLTGAKIVHVTSDEA